MNQKVNSDNRYFFPGDLIFYHPNMKGSGSAAQFELKPAIRGREGCFFLVMARQNSEMIRRGNGKNRTATFDWKGAVTVKLGLSDIGQMLLVLHNRQAAIANGKGLFHDTADANTIIQLRKAEKTEGYILDLSHKAKRDGAEPNRVWIILTEAEALTLRLVFEQAMLYVVHGLPTLISG